MRNAPSPAMMNGRFVTSAKIARRFPRWSSSGPIRLAPPAIAIYASALTGEAVAAKQFASREFDRPTYLAGASAKLKRRLARARERPRYRFRAH